MEKINPRQSFPELEKEILDFWEKEKIFEKSLEKPSPKGDFVFFEGPPTANGHPGIHHVLARAFKDVIPRYKTMAGYNVARKAGWDTHGLPVELEVEKKLGISGKPQIESIKSTKEESIIEFNRLCRESVWTYKSEWEEMTKRMGFWVDLDHPYITYENDYIESVWWVISEAFKKDLVYKGHKIVPYCPRCGTALSSHELAQGYKEVEEDSVYLKFKLMPYSNNKSNNNYKIKDWPIDDRTYILSWTTTPWTLPGNVALAVAKDVNYVIISDHKTGNKYILAKNLLSDVLKFYPEKESHEYDIFQEIKGDDLIGLEYEKLFNHAIPEETNPSDKKAFKIYPADFVTTEDGTGVVHTAVMYGEDDYQLGEQVGLPKVHTVDTEGKFSFHDVGGFEILKGLNGRLVKNKETEKIIIDYLKKQGENGASGLFGEPAPYKHDYPFCWRCDTALIYYAKDSWFIAMSKLRENLVKNNENINWIPDNIKHGRFGEWLVGAKDWAISRDRYWGTPLPFWVCQNSQVESEKSKVKSCGKIVCINSIQELKDKATNFAEIYPNENEIDLHKPYIDGLKLKCDCGGEMTRTPEVADCWLDSGSMPYAQWHYPIDNREMIDEKKFFPADYISEAIDQTRGWFYTLLAISTFLELGSPYKNVICLGHIMDSKGLKMSKSKGNILDPMAMAESHGFDAIRWYMYTNNQPGDIKLVSEESIKDQVRRFFLILWNTYSFHVAYSNMKNFTNTQTAQSTNLFDKWLVSKKNKLIKRVTESLDRYDVFTAARAIEEFAIELSTWYLRRNKKRDDEDFLQTLHATLVDVAKLLAPFAPFISESIYRNLTNEDSVHLSDWPIADDGLIDDVLENEMRLVREVIESGHAIRKEQNIKVRQPLSAIEILNFKPKHDLKDIILDELNIKELDFVNSFSEGENWIKREKPMGDLLVPLVSLNTEITPELKREGLMRDIVRLVQDARKEAGYAFDEKVDCFVTTESAEIREVFEQFNEEIKKTAALSDISMNATDNADVEKEGELEGEKIILWLKG